MRFVSIFFRLKWYTKPLVVAWVNYTTVKKKKKQKVKKGDFKSCKVNT